MNLYLETEQLWLLYNICMNLHNKQYISWWTLFSNHSWLENYAALLLITSNCRMLKVQHFHLKCGALHKCREIKWCHLHFSSLSSLLVKPQGSRSEVHPGHVSLNPDCSCVNNSSCVMAPLSLILYQSVTEGRGKVYSNVFKTLNKMYHRIVHHYEENLSVWGYTTPHGQWCICICPHAKAETSKVRHSLCNDSKLSCSSHKPICTHIY